LQWFYIWEIYYTIIVVYWLLACCESLIRNTSRSLQSKGRVTTMGEFKCPLVSFNNLCVYIYRPTWYISNPLPHYCVHLYINPLPAATIVSLFDKLRIQVRPVDKCRTWFTVVVVFSVKLIFVQLFRFRYVLIQCLIVSSVWPGRDIVLPNSNCYKLPNKSLGWVLFTLLFFQSHSSDIGIYAQ